MDVQIISKVENEEFYLYIYLILSLFVSFQRLITGKNEKVQFLTCHCHEIYREEAVDLKGYSYTLEIISYASVNSEIWGSFVENWYFVNSSLIEIRI